MCPGNSHSSPPPISAENVGEVTGPPDWETIPLPPAHILAHLTDAHCHPTDLDLPSSDFDDVQLGGMCAMSTDPWNQEKVMCLGEDRIWGDKLGSPSSSSSASSSSPALSPVCAAGGESKGKSSVLVISAFGYHPWFTHLYTLSTTPISKEEHYVSIFFKRGSSATSKNRQLLTTLLPYLPEPLSFPHLLDGLKRDIQTSKSRGTHTLLGEVGLDGSARVRWPPKARHLYTEKYGSAMGEEDVLDDQGEWKRLTPFKVSMDHQKEIFRLQLEIAVELGVCASVHSVSAAGPTMDVLLAIRDKYGSKFTNCVNVDIHSGGGWSPEFWKQAEKQLVNLYASPSIFITGRSAHADDLIYAINPDRVLVESDSHDARLSTRLVWAAAVWIGRVKGWKIEGDDSSPSFEEVDHVKANVEEREDGEWDFEGGQEDEETFDERGKPVPQGTRWTVRTLERNMARFLRTCD